MKETIHRYTPTNEYYFHEGCHILELSNSPNDQQVSIARAMVKPGVTTRWHSLKETTERYVILEGTGTVWVGDMKECVGKGDVVVIPPGCRMRIQNTGMANLTFLAICSPRFQQENYIDLENSLKDSGSK